MPSDTNLTGRWAGNYYQHDRPRPITADLVQDGERVTGSMSDGVPDKTYTLFDFAADLGLPPGADEQIHAHLRETFPDQEGAPIHFVTHLPPESTLEGWVRSSTVYFLKSYDGAHFSGFQVGDKLVGQRVENHAVHYRGKLSPDGSEIDGKWWIGPDSEVGTRRTEGYFTLRRQQARSALRSTIEREMSLSP